MNSNQHSVIILQFGKFRLPCLNMPISYSKQHFWSLRNISFFQLAPFMSSHSFRSRYGKVLYSQFHNIKYCIYLESLASALHLPGIWLGSEECVWIIKPGRSYQSVPAPVREKSELIGSEEPRWNMSSISFQVTIKIIVPNINLRYLVKLLPW